MECNLKANGNDALVSANIIYNANAGVCGIEDDNLTWELSGGTLTISGTGAMQNYSYAEFWGCSALKSIPDSEECN